MSPNYIQTQYGHVQDVAVLMLHESVAYTDLVRPVCLWPANELDIEKVIGKNGVVCKD